jgi:hypothetical protein
MSTLPNTYDFLETFIMEQGMRIASVIPDKAHDTLTILLTNGHSLKMRLSKYKKLFDATEQALANYLVIADRSGIRWPDIDEDLSLKGLLKAYFIHKVETEQELVIA